MYISHRPVENRLSLAPGSPSLDLVGATSADILVTGIEFAPLVWAQGSGDLGLQQGDAIDALCIKENGNSTYDVEDLVLFSLAAGSPTLTSLSAGPSALLRPSPLRVAVGPGSLGLAAADDVDALVCSSGLAFTARYLPMILKGP